MQEPEWTPIQQKMIDLLDDGQSHSREELHKFMLPSSIASLKDHIARMRVKLAPIGQTIIAEYWMRQCHYRRVILYGEASRVNGRKGSA